MKPALTRRFQFSVRTMLFAVSLIAGFIASVGHYGGPGIFLFLAGLGGVLVVSSIWNRSPNRATLGTILMLVTLPYFGSASRFIHHTTQRVQVVVKDAHSGEPISGAQVSLYPTSHRNPRLVAATDQYGNALLQARFKTSNHQLGLGRSGRIWLWEHTLQVESFGHQPLTCPLYDMTGKTHDLYGSELPPVVVELARAR
ncbi:MAG: hypothetical protein MPJ50_07825 [Pirellulales bacterium]|nr:hypothetical protein [Pirellulales bacterium]